MKTKFSKRLLSAVLALVMVVSAFASLPFTTSAADYTGTLTYGSRIYIAAHDASSSNRLDQQGTGSINICNDGQASNFCTGAWFYDLAAIPSEIGTITANVSINVAKKESEVKDVSIYAVFNNPGNFSNVSNTASAALAKFTNPVKLGSFTNNATGVRATYEVGEHIKNAKTNGTAFGIYAIMETAGDSSQTGPWTDCHITPPSIAVEVTAPSSGPDVDVTGNTNKEALENAIDLYLARMESIGAEGGKVYTNMKPAYDAYLDAVRKLDAFTYGTAAESQLIEAKNNLMNKYNAMHEFTPYKGTATGYYFDTTATGGYDNLLYSSRGTSGFTYGDGWATAGNVRAKVYYAKNIVMLYDGVNEAGFPVVLGVCSTRNWRDQAQQYTLTNVHIDSPTTVALKHNWYGKLGGDQWQTWPNKTTSVDDVSYQASGGKAQTDTNKTPVSYNNEIYYNSSNNEVNYYESIKNSDQKITFNVVSGSTVGKMGVSSNNPSNIYAINYKVIYDFVTDANRRNQIAKARYMKEGGLSTLLTAMDNCTAFNPNTYFSGANDSNVATQVTSCANKIKELHAATKGISPTGDQYYGEGYQALRDALDADGVRVAYKAGNVRADGEQKYTTESWNNFFNIMKAAESFMTAVSTRGYTNEGNETAKSYVNDELMHMDIPTYFAALELLFTPVVTTRLEAAIDRFEGYNNIFTDESYNNAASIVKTAKETVWGSEENYKSAGDALEKTVANTAIVTEQTNLVNNAITALKFSPDAVVTTELGQYSLNQAIALKDTITDPLDYGNYGDYEAAINSANEYKAQLQAADFTDYDVQLEEYVAAVTEALNAYYSLEYSFIKIPDGTIARNAGIQTLDMYHGRSGSGRYWNIQFSYPAAGTVIIRTKHNATNINYGQASVYYGTTSPRSSNMLDSITIDATANDVLEINANGGAAGSDAWATALTDAQKQTYAGKLSTAGTNGSNFALKNFRVAEVSQYNTKDIYGITEGGVTIAEKVSPTDEYTKMLGTTTGAHASPLPGGVYAASRVSGDQYGAITMAADMVVSIPATTKPTLSATTVPTSTQYILDGKYFGALYSYDHVVNTINWEGYGFMKSTEPISSVVTVVDISPLVELVDECNVLLDKSLIDYSQMYTAETWADFTAQLAAAQASINYTSISATTLTSTCETRYNNLWTAYKALKVREIPVTFNYKDSTGADTSTTINVEWGKKINTNYGSAETNYADMFNAISTPDYVSVDGLYTYKFDKWSPDFNAANPVKAEATFTATYLSELNPADFIPYNASVASLIGALTDRTFTLADLTAIKDELAGMTYFSLTDEQKAALKGDVQAQINAEKARIDEIKNGLTPSTVQLDVAEATVQAKKTCQDIDAYDVDSLDSFEYLRNIEVAGKTVEALIYATQEELDAAIDVAVENLNKKQYTISLDGVEIGTVEYGTPVIINSDGQLFTNVADLSTAEHDGSKLLAWSYSYAAPSRNNAYTSAKYMLTGKSVGFIVKGDTKLTTKNAGNTETGFTVKFMTNDGKVFDVEYTTDGTVTMPTAPAYAYYTFTGYSNGLNAGDTFAVTKNETIIANYTADAKSRLTIVTATSLGIWESAEGLVYNDCDYGDRLDLSVSNAYCWAIADYTEERNTYEYHILSYGPSYSFLATRSYTDDLDNKIYKGIVALTYNEYKEILDRTDGTKIFDGAGNQIVTTTVDFVTQYPDLKPDVSVLDSAIPVYGEDGSLKKVTMVGTFALPDGYTIVEAGVLFSSNLAADMTVEKVGTDGIARFKASGHTCGNQFVINVNTPASAGAFQYKGYATAQGPDGKLVTVYSKAVADDANNYRGA